MTAAKTAPRRTGPTIKTLWAIAKSPELGMTDEDLHALVYRETGKGSLRELTARELGTVARVLQNLKDGTRRDTRSRRTDEGGNPATVRQRRLIWHLCEELGWNNDYRRIQRFVKKVTGTDRLEWLTPQQCGQVIEALKAMAAREKRKEDGQDGQ